MTQNIEGSKT